MFELVSCQFIEMESDAGVRACVQPFILHSRRAAIVVVVVVVLVVLVEHLLCIFRYVFWFCVNREWWCGGSDGGANDMNLLHDDDFSRWIFATCTQHTQPHIHPANCVRR